MICLTSAARLLLLGAIPAWLFAGCGGGSDSIGGPDSIARYLTRADGTQVGAQVLAEAMARAAAQVEKDRASSPTQPQMTPERMREQQRQMAYQLAEGVVRG